MTCIFCEGDSPLLYPDTFERLEARADTTLVGTPGHEHRRLDTYVRYSDAEVRYCTADGQLVSDDDTRRILSGAVGRAAFDRAFDHYRSVCNGQPSCGWVSSLILRRDPE